LNLWKPLVKRSDEDWVGITDEPGIWVGTGQTPRARVDLKNPVFLWPLLERRRSTVCDELRGAWADLANKGMQSPEELVEVIVDSAVHGWQPYWVELAVDWMQGMEKEPGYRVIHLRKLLSEISESSVVGQATRHKARRALRDFIRSDDVDGE
jgi:hypothetical protein